MMSNYSSALPMEEAMTARGARDRSSAVMVPAGEAAPADAVGPLMPAPARAGR